MPQKKPIDKKISAIQGGYLPLLKIRSMSTPRWSRPIMYIIVGHLTLENKLSLIHLDDLRP